MSDQSNITPESSKPARKRVSTKLIPLSSCHVTFAKSKSIDVTRAAKLNRSYMRSNYDALLKVWPDLRKSHKVNRDGNRWPAMIPANVADQIVKRTIPASRA